MVRDIYIFVHIYCFILPRQDRDHIGVMLESLICFDPRGFIPWIRVSWLQLTTVLFQQLITGRDAFGVWIINFPTVLCI